MKLRELCLGCFHTRPYKFCPRCKKYVEEEEE